MIADGDERDGAEGQEGNGRGGTSGAADEHGHAVLANAAATACGKHKIAVSARTVDASHEGLVHWVSR